MNTEAVCTVAVDGRSEEQARANHQIHMSERDHYEDETRRGEATIESVVSIEGVYPIRLAILGHVGVDLARDRAPYVFVEPCHFFDCDAEARTSLSSQVFYLLWREQAWWVACHPVGRHAAKDPPEQAFQGVRNCCDQMARSVSNKDEQAEFAYGHSILPREDLQLGIVERQTEHQDRAGNDDPDLLIKGHLLHD